MAEFGEYTVDLMSEEILEGFTIRTLDVLHRKVSETSDKGQRGKSPDKGQTKSILYTPFKITSERGQPFYKGQMAGS